jgi:transposase
MARVSFALQTTHSLTNMGFWRFKLDLNELIKYYKEKYPVKTAIDWAGYEKEYKKRLDVALKEIRPIIKEAASALIKNTKLIGRPPEISIEDKVMLLLLKDIFDTSNRKTAGLLPLFSHLSRLKTTYKTVERLYSDPLVSIVMHNMFVIMVKKKGIVRADLSGDGTGYGLTVTKHYSTNVRKENGKKKTFAYAFAFIDLNTKMYVGYGTGMRSEMEAFNAARGMMTRIGIEVDSVKLDRYYTFQSIIQRFGSKTKFYIIPKKSTTSRGNSRWHEIWRSFMRNSMVFLKEYYRRESSESNSAADKKSNGWQVWQRRDDRIATAVMCNGVWHNLLLIGRG